MWDDELLERIPSTSATNIEAGLRDRVRELRDRGRSGARSGIEVGMKRQSAYGGSSASTGGRGERLVRGQALAEAA